MFMSPMDTRSEKAKPLTKKASKREVTLCAHLAFQGDGDAIGRMGRARGCARGLSTKNGDIRSMRLERAVGIIQHGDAGQL